MASTIPNGVQQFLDNNGNPLVGGRVHFYIPGTTTAKDTWQDPDLTILNTNPITLNARGEATVWGNGRYRQVVYDKRGNLIWDRITQSAGADMDSAATNELRQDLADSEHPDNGAGMVAWSQPFSGAYAVTVAEKLSKKIEYLDFVPPSLREKIRSGKDELTDQYPYFLAFRDALAKQSASTGSAYGAITQCRIFTSKSPNFAIPGLTLETTGSPQIICTGTDPGFRADATNMGPGGWGLFGLNIGEIIAGSLNGDSGIDIRYCHQSTLGPLKGLGAKSKAINLYSLVSSTVNTPICSESINGEFVVRPRYGIWVGAESGDSRVGSSGWTTLVNPIAEHVTEGLVIDRAHGTNIVGGVAESCSSVGLVMTQNAVYTTINGMDLEANGQFDAYCGALHGLFNNIKSEGRFHLTGLASLNVFNGGVFNAISLDPETRGNTFSDLLYSSQQGGGISNMGTGNFFRRCWDHQNELFFSNWQQAEGIKVFPQHGTEQTDIKAKIKYLMDGNKTYIQAEVNFIYLDNASGHLELLLPFSNYSEIPVAMSAFLPSNAEKYVSSFIQAYSNRLLIFGALVPGLAQDGSSVFIQGFIENLAR